jgi:hypothetical protein
MEEPHDDATMGGELRYSYKSSLMGAAFEFRLMPDAFEWVRGRSKGRVAYDGIRRIRLGFRPMTMQNHRFIAEIWPVNGPKLMIASTSWKSLVEHERFDGPYRTFVTELCRRIGAAGGQARFQTGSPVIFYWLGVAVFIGASLAMAALIVRALQADAWSGAAFVGAFFAFFLWQAGTFFRRNRPGTFEPDAIPRSVLPSG